MAYSAVHLPGGNFFDDVRLDLPASYATQDEWLAQVTKTSVRAGVAKTAARRAAHRVEPYRVREALVNAGLKRQWFEEFRGYWESVLNGRELTMTDFHGLRFHYRRHAQTMAELPWSGPDAHLANWQAPKNLFQTFYFAYRAALHPVWGGRLLFDLHRSGTRVLEYGCSLAPMYRTWRTFLSSKPSQWVLADIPGHAFHYARHVYGNDAEAELAVIDDFEDPLAEVEGGFDLVIVQTVFEHLDHPRSVAEYLVDRLKPGGLLWFDYPRTEGTGLDTPTSLAERRATLEYLAASLDVVHGELRVDDRSLGTCVGRKHG